MILATGTRPPELCGSVLLDRLLDRGLARPDRHRLGLDIDPTFAVINRRGTATPSLWAIGPLGTGVLWECTAVPDIRLHAITVAEQVVATVCQGSAETAPVFDPS